MSKTYSPSGYGDKKGKGKTSARRLQRHRDKVEHHPECGKQRHSGKGGGVVNCKACSPLAR